LEGIIGPFPLRPQFTSGEVEKVSITFHFCIGWEFTIWLPLLPYRVSTRLEGKNDGGCEIQDFNARRWHTTHLIYHTLNEDPHGSIHFSKHSSQYLQSHPDDQLILYILQGISSGFSIGFHLVFSMSGNLISSNSAVIGMGSNFIKNVKNYRISSIKYTSCLPGALTWKLISRKHNAALTSIKAPIWSPVSP